MKKIISLVLTITIITTILASCGNKTESSPAAQSNNEASQSGGELSLYSWEGMFPDQVLRDFTEETGITVNFSAYDMGETMLAKLEADKKGVYDLVIADDYIIDLVIEKSLAKPLDKAKLSNYGNINPKYQGQFFDPTDEYTVPYGSGVQTIVYDPALVDIEITGYEDLWNPTLKDSIGIIGNYRVIDGAVLKTMGESYNTEDIATIEAAGAKLKELSPNIRVIKDDNLQNDIISGEISAAIMYTSQVTMAKLARPDLEVVFPSEGIGFGIMGQFIPASAPNSDAAHAFIDYILRPEVAAVCFENLGYYTTNLAAEDFISPEYKEFLTLPSNFSGNMEMIQTISPEAEEAHSKIWTEFKADK